MSRKFQFALLALIAILVAGFLMNGRFSKGSKSGNLVVAVKEPNGIPLAEVWSIVSEFSVTDVSGHTLSAEQLRGKVLLVDFWATWCQPCEKEMPGYQRLQEKYRDRGLVVIGIAFDGDMKMGNETVEHYATRLGIKYPLVLDTPELQEKFGSIKGLPTTFLIDRNRKIRLTVIGFEYTEKIEAALVPLF